MWDSVFWSGKVAAFEVSFTVLISTVTQHNKSDVSLLGGLELSPSFASPGMAGSLGVTIVVAVEPNQDDRATVADDVENRPVCMGL